MKMIKHTKLGFFSFCKESLITFSYDDSLCWTVPDCTWLYTFPCSQNPTPTGLNEKSTDTYSQWTPEKLLLVKKKISSNTHLKHLDFHCSQRSKNPAREVAPGQEAAQTPKPADKRVGGGNARVGRWLIQAFFSSRENHSSYQHGCYK